MSRSYKSVDQRLNRRPLTGGGCRFAAAAVPALLYLAYVAHYALDVPLSDDWGLIGLASHARHHHVAMAELWSQYADTRLFVGRVVFAVFGLLDHLNLKHIILFSAITYIASFAILLLLFRSYLQRRLTFLSVLSLAVVWFSVADFQNALWTFNSPGTSSCSSSSPWRTSWSPGPSPKPVLRARDRVRDACFTYRGPGIRRVGRGPRLPALGTPARAPDLLRVRSGSPRQVLVTAIYLHNFDFRYADNICRTEGGSKGTCSLAYGALHPVSLARFLAVLAGNVVPTRTGLLCRRSRVARGCDLDRDRTGAVSVGPGTAAGNEPASGAPDRVRIAVRSDARSVPFSARPGRGRQDVVHDAEHHLAQRHCHLCLAILSGSADDARTDPRRPPHDASRSPPSRHSFSFRQWWRHSSASPMAELPSKHLHRRASACKFHRYPT